MRIVFAIFAAVLVVVSTIAMFTDGYFAIFGVAFESWAGAQVFADLCVALCFAARWLIRDARTTGRNPWPWLLAIPPLGSLSPLGYFVWTRYVAPAEVSAAGAAGAPAA